MLGAALAATLMILTAVWVAPSHRTPGGLGHFHRWGFLLAGYLGWSANAWAPFTAATVAGAGHAGGRHQTQAMMDAARTKNPC